ncbi:band 4.1-like protein 4B [Latimeria chalumnae]|uniref:band 4.1-like protein 4B n=1 Tax=Latimeria chalumnae TaxID=7897 RepID=UPI00313BB5CC
MSVPKEEAPVTNLSKTSSLQEHNVRSPALVPKDSSSQPGGTTEKQQVKVSRQKKLTRQFSFNHSDEDDLPPALAAASQSSSLKTSTSQTSEGQLQSSTSTKNTIDFGSNLTVEPGDLLMDFTEATPLIKTIPADGTNPFFDPFASLPQLPVEVMDKRLQCCGFPTSPVKSSPVAHMHAVRAFTEPIPVLQTAHMSHKTSSLTDSAEALRRELEQEKMMKRLLMTEL